MRNRNGSNLKKVANGEIRGYVREEIASLLPPPFFDDPLSAVQKMGAEIVKESRLRWAAVLTLPNRQRIFFKRNRTKNWFEALKFFLLPSKAQKEWLVSYELQKRNNPIPRPLGWMEKRCWGVIKESYYLSEAVGSGVGLIDDPEKKRDQRTVSDLAEAVRRIHEAGLFHLDFHAGNLLWDGERFLLIDLHRARVLKSLSLTQRLWNLAELFHSLRSSWGEKEQLGFLERYFQGAPVSPEKKKKYLGEIRAWMDRLQKKQWASRTKRCLKESTEFSITKGKGIRSYHRRDFSLENAKEAIERHRRFVSENTTELVKNSPEVSVSIFEHLGGRISVKQFRYLHLPDRLKERFRKSKGLKAWVAGNGLRAREIPSLKPLVLVEKGSWVGLRETFFLMEAPERGLEMDRYILRGFKDLREKRGFVRTFGQWVSSFHRMDLYHSDMKTCNILVEEGGGTWRFLLLDLEDVSLNCRIDEGKVFRNFLQLNTSTPGILTGRDRMRFYREYLRTNPVIRNERVFLRRLFEKSRERGLVYVSPEGVVEEKL